MILLVLSVIFILMGCENKVDQKSVESSAKDRTENRKEEVFKVSKELAKGYKDIYIAAQKSQNLNSIEYKQQIVDYLDEAGYPAVDYDNQIDMVHHEQVEAFCEKAERTERYRDAI